MADRAPPPAVGCDDLTIARLNEFARELEARAAALEQDTQVFKHSDAAAMRRADPNIGEVKGWPMRHDGVRRTAGQGRARDRR